MIFQITVLLFHCHESHCVPIQQNDLQYLDFLHPILSTFVLTHLDCVENLNQGQMQFYVDLMFQSLHVLCHIHSFQFPQYILVLQPSIQQFSLFHLDDDSYYQYFWLNLILIVQVSSLIQVHVQVDLHLDQ